EVITYEVAYNWGMVWVNAGEVFFKADTIGFQGSNCYYFESRGKSHDFYNWFFKVDDRYQSWCDYKSIKPIAFRRNTSEGGYWVDNSYTFEPGDRVFSSVLHKDKSLRLDTLQAKPCTFDVLSAIYHVRGIDFSDVQKDEGFPVNFIIDGELFTLSLVYLGKEDMKSRYGESYLCDKFSVKLVEGTIFKEDEELFVWLIDDENRIPLMVEAKVMVGSIKAYLIGHKGLKYDFPESLDE
ncbi:MAG: DUF3108 domain-containing protein, partial [Bacteroidetes bacterium]